MYIDGQFAIDIDFTSGLPAKSYSEVSITITGGLVNGTHDIEFIADSLSEVAESNEGNNTRIESWPWTGGVPDLQLTDIYTPTSLTAGQDTTITAKVTNIGYADAGPFNLAMYIDGQPVLDMPISSGLYAWYYLEANITAIGGLSAGEHCIKFYADYYHSVSELNEGNNERTECFTWTQGSPTQPDPPTGVSVFAGPGSGDVTISWNLSGSPDVDHYRIYEGTSPGVYYYAYDNIPAGWHTGTIISGLTDGTTYYFAMTAVNSSGLESNLSNETSATPSDTGDSQPPTNPGNLTITDPGTGKKLVLNWNASTDDTQVSHYMVFRLTNNSYVSEYNYDGGFPKYVTSTNFTDTGLIETNTYYYRVSAVDTSDNWSGLSNLAWDMPDDNISPDAPPYVDLAAGNAFVDVWWSAPTTNTDGSQLDDLAGFNIYRGTISGYYNPSPINGAYPYSGLSFTDTSVINGQTYYYVIRAVDYEGNESPASYEVSDTPDVADDPPSVPANLSITEKQTELLLTWAPNYESDLVGYNVYRGTSSGSYSLIASLGTYEWYVDQNVQAGQTYYYVVTAEDSGGNESAYSNEVSGMIGQGEIWIISPTSSSPAILDILQSQSAVESGQAPITTQSIGMQVKISYDFNVALQFVSEIYLEISDSTSGQVVYKLSEWRPPWTDPHFMWNGKYNTGPDKGKCVPDGWYNTRLYLKVFGVFGAYAETVEKRSIQVVGCLASMIQVQFAENTAQSYGFDNYTNPDLPWKSVKTGSSDTAKAIITPASDANKVYFNSTAPSNVTVSPSQASSSPQTVTVTGIAKGESDIQANIASANGYTRATMRTAAYNELTKSLAIILVHEDNDDVQVIPAGSQGQPYQICVSAGTNGASDTIKSGDDNYAGQDIDTGADGICNSSANNTDIISTNINEGTLETLLNNTIYKQAVVYWNTVDRRPDCIVNFDLNKDGKLDVSSWMTSEMQVIRDNCGNSNYHHNIFLVDNPNDGSTGFMYSKQRYGFVHVANSSEPYRTVAHELGHGAFDLQHTPTDSINIMYNYSSTTKWRLRKNQWDKSH